MPGPSAELMPNISVLSEFPIQIAVSRVGVYPIASTSCRLSVVPVFSAAGRPIVVNGPKTNEPCTGSVLSLRMLVMTHAYRSSMTCLDSGFDAKSFTTLPLLSTIL